MFSPYLEGAQNGRHHLLDIETVKNGWLVTYYPKPENPNSEEYQKRQKELLEKRIENEKEEFARRLKEQTASMKLAGEAMMKIKEDWEEDEDPDSFKRIDEIAEKIAEMHPPRSDERLLNYIGIVPAPKEPVSMIFTNKDDLFKFLVESL